MRGPNRVAMILPFMWGAAAAAAGDAEEKPAGGIDSTPSFFLMQEKLYADRERNDEPLTRDVEASNGVIHVIDTVLIPQIAA